MIQLASIRTIRTVCPIRTAVARLFPPMVAATSVSSSLLSSLSVLSLLLSVLSLPSPATADEDVFYVYDERDRLTHAISGGTEVVYAYDDVGNRFIVAVPEPGGVVPLALGVLALVGFAYRGRSLRRRSAGRRLVRRPGGQRLLPARRHAVRPPPTGRRVAWIGLLGFALGLGAALVVSPAPAGAQTEAPPGFEAVDPAFWMGGTGSPSAMAATAAEPGTALVASFPGSATEITPEIAALARALRHDVDLIYEFVASEIDYSLIWGSHKGALGTLLDRKGGDFDQASLMIALLRASGYEASYVYGQQRLEAADVVNWLGFSTITPNGMTRWISLSGREPALNPVTAQSGQLVRVDLERVWVKVRIDGTDYVFDPAFKVHDVKPGIDLGAAMGYDRASLMAGALAGATVTASSVQSLNDANLRQTLSDLSTNLADVIRDQHLGSRIEDIVGGRVIQPPSESPRQTSLPGQQTLLAEWSELPASRRACVRLTLPGLDETLNADALAGRRLTIFYESNRPVLRLDGETIATGSSVALGSNQNLRVEADHPFARAFADRVGTTSILAGGRFLLLNDWGSSGEGLVRHHELRQRKFSFEGGDVVSEPVLGESLAVFAASWMTQVHDTCQLASQMVQAYCFSFHNIGIAGQTDSPFVDIPFSVGTISRNTGDVDFETFFAFAGHGSVLEGGVIEQLQPDARAVSTVSLVGTANDQSSTFFDVTAETFPTIRPQLMNYTTGDLNTIQARVDQGARVLLPRNGRLLVDEWAGVGLLSIVVNPGGAAFSFIISGGLNGGFAARPLTFDPIIFPPHEPPEFQSFDPINLVTGDFLYDEVDLTVGSQPFPLGLEFKKSYSSSSRHRDGPLGIGWSHNFDIQTRSGSDGFQAFGKDSPLDAVAAVVEMFVSLDLTAVDASTSELLVAMLAQRWFMDQRTNNTVAIQQPDRASVFVRLPDGTFSPPPGSASTLLENPDGRHQLITKQGLVLDFRAEDGRITSWRDPNGNTVSFTYSGEKLQRVDDAVGHRFSFTYTGDHISSVSDGIRSFTYAYDGADQLTTVTDAANEMTTFAYAGGDAESGLLESVFTPANPTNPRVLNTYDSLGHVETQLDANGHLWTYHIAGSRSEEIDPTGASKIAYYDRRGQKIRDIDALGFETLTEVDGEDRVVLKIEPEGNFSEFEYDERHNVTKVTSFPKPGSPLAPIVREMTYEPVFNRVKTETDPRGGVTRFSYDDFGNPIEIEQPTASAQTPITTFIYNGRGQVKETTDAEGTVTEFDYDPATADLLTRTEDVGGLNLVTTMKYNDTGDVIFESDPRGNRVLLEPDAMRRVTRTQAPAPFNFVTRLTYDEEGHLTLTERQMADPAPWQTTTMTYTLSGKLKTVADPEQQVTTTTYDSLDRVGSQIDAKGRTTQLLYTPRGNLERILDPNDRPTEIRTYTPSGQLASVTDANGNKTEFQYDGFDRLRRTVFPDETFEQLAYDPASNVVERTTRSGATIDFTYDALGRIYTKKASDDSIIIFGYDRMGRLKSEFQAGGATTFQYDALGRLIAKTDRNSRTVGYRYDGAGNRTRLTYPNGHFVTYEYDELNRLRGIRDANATQDIVTYGYDSLSRRISTTRSNGTSTTRVWELDDDLELLRHQFPGGTLTWSYAYDAVHNRIQTSVPDSRFSFDLSQLIPATYSTNELNQYTSVTLGTAGGSGGSGGGDNPPIGPGQRPTPPLTPSYDAQGNLTTVRSDRYTHDAQNRLVEATRSDDSDLSARYFYDAAGNRVRKTVDGVTTQYVLDGNQLLEEYDGQGQLLRRYVHAGLDEPVRMNTGPGAQLGGGAEFYYHQDGLGSVVALSSVAGFMIEPSAYGPYGETEGASPRSNPFRYTGREYDAETGLYYYRARYYSTGLGRFLEPDPIGFGDGLNVYAYVGNNPINFVDPLGLFATGQSGGVRSPQSVVFPGPGGEFISIDPSRDIEQQFRAEANRGTIAAGVSAGLLAVGVGGPAAFAALEQSTIVNQSLMVAAAAQQTLARSGGANFVRGGIQGLVEGFTAGVSGAKGPLPTFPAPIGTPARVAGQKSGRLIGKGIGVGVRKAGDVAEILQRHGF